MSTTYQCLSDRQRELIPLAKEALKLTNAYPLLKAVLDEAALPTRKTPTTFPEPEVYIIEHVIFGLRDWESDTSMTLDKYIFEVYLALVSKLQVQDANKLISDATKELDKLKNKSDVNSIKYADLITKLGISICPSTGQLSDYYDNWKIPLTKPKDEVTIPDQVTSQLLEDMATITAGFSHNLEYTGDDVKAYKPTPWLPSYMLSSGGKLYTSYLKSAVKTILDLENSPQRNYPLDLLILMVIDGLVLDADKKQALYNSIIKYLQKEKVQLKQTYSIGNFIVFWEDVRSKADVKDVKDKSAVLSAMRTPDAVQLVAKLEAWNGTPCPIYLQYTIGEDKGWYIAKRYNHQSEVSSVMVAMKHLLQLGYPITGIQLNGHRIEDTEALASKLVKDLQSAQKKNNFKLDAFLEAYTYMYNDVSYTLDDLFLSPVNMFSELMSLA